MRKNKVVIFFGAAFLIMLAGCSGKKDNPTASGNNLNLSDPSILSLNTPDRALLLCGSERPGQAYVYTTLAEKFDSLFNHLSPSGTHPDSTIDGDSIVYTWTAEQLGIKLIRYDTGASYGWKIVFDGNKLGVIYNDWIYIGAGEKKDRSTGWMQTLENVPGATDYRWDWMTVGGQTTVIITWSSGADQIEFQIVLNTDRTGYCEYYKNDAILWKVDWGSGRPSCSGMWYEYSGGHLTASATWGYSGG